MLLLEKYQYYNLRKLIINESRQYQNSVVNRELKKEYPERPYSVYSETTDLSDSWGGESELHTMDIAYSDKDMGYIGEPKKADQLWKKFGIEFECIDKSHSVCSIGWSEKDSKYYGWSHRAICGFGIGDKIFDSNYLPQGEKTPFTQHGKQEIKSKADARKSAIKFAKYVA